MSAENPQITIVTKDQQTITASKKVLSMMGPVGRALDTDPRTGGHADEMWNEVLFKDAPIPIGVNKETLQVVIRWCEIHQDEDQTAKVPRRDKHNEPIPQCDKPIFENITQNQLHNLIMAANYLEITNLLDIACQIAAYSIKGKTPDEICEFWGFKNDLSAEDKRELANTHGWCL